MKPEEAIEDIRKCIQPSVGGKSLQMAIQALEKQMPVNPNGYDNGGAEDYEEWAECPKCSESIPEYTLENEKECYCIGCGQKLDWGTK